VVMMHLRNQPPPLSGVPLQLSAIVMRALEKDPKKRQQTAEELDGQCQRCLQELYPRNTPGAGIPRVTAPPPSEPPSRARPAPPPAAPPPRSQPQPSVLQSGKGRTLALPSGSQPALPPRTVALPETSGVVAFAAEARRAREAAEAEEPPSGAGPLFWLAWALIGVGAGLAAHFYLVSRGGP